MPAPCFVRLLLLFFCLGFGSLQAFTAIAAESKSLPHALVELENSSGGRLGVAAIDTGNGAEFGYRATERFPFCSTFKALLVAAVLDKSVQEETLLDKQITYTRKDLVSWSPITEKRTGQGMTVRELCAASLQYSDNTATNLLLHLLGGADAVNTFARSIGDNDFSLSDFEPVLNSALPGDARNTTTPSSMARSLQKIALGIALQQEQQRILQEWLKGNTTGNDSIRAGVPATWIVGDKTGSGNYGTTNDIAVIWPPDRAPLIYAVYFTQKTKKAPARKDVLASVAKLLSTLPWNAEAQQVLPLPSPAKP